MSRSRWARALALSTGYLCVCNSVWGQQPPGQQRPDQVPPVIIESPRVTPPLATEAGLDPSQASSFVPGYASSGFNFRGSPFGDYRGTATSSLTGSPIDPFDASRSYSTLDSARIGQSSSVNTPELLDGIPGVLVQRTNLGGGSFFIRGRNGNQNLIMVDGIPINDAGWRFGNVQYLNYIDPGVIERIEVIRGPSSVLWGSGALGGTLNIITKSRKDFCDEFMGLDGGMITTFSTALQGGYSRVEAGGRFSNFGVLAGGSYQTLNTFFAGQDVTFPEYATGYDQIAGDIRLDWRMDRHWTGTFVYQHFFQNDVPRTDRYPLPQVNPFRFENRPTVSNQERDFSYLRFNYENENGLLNGLQLTFAIQRRHEREDELLLAQRNAQGQLVTQRTRLRAGSEEVNYGGVDLRGRTDFNPNHHLSYGVTYWQQYVDSTRFQVQSALPGGSIEGLQATQITPTLPNDGKYDEFGVFVYDTINLTERWNVGFGGRYSNINTEGTARFLSTNPPPVFFDLSFQDWSGEAGTTFKLNDNIHWFGNISEGFRAPNLEDLGANERSTAIGADSGNINLQTERATSFETGLKFRSERFAGSATWYHMNLASQIVRALAPNASVSRTNTRGYIEGVEVEGVIFLTENWSLFGAGSRTYGDDETRIEPLRVPPSYFVGGIRWSGRGPWCSPMFAEVFSELSGKQTRLGEFDLRDIRVPIGGTAAWQTLNVRGGIDMQQFGRLTLGLYNLFDQNYRVHGSGIDGPGFEFRGGYEIRF